MKNSGIKRIVSAILIISLGGAVMLGLSGCFGKKYKVDYCGQKGSFEGAKDSYRAGERVELRFCHIATDMGQSDHQVSKSLEARALAI